MPRYRAAWVLPISRPPIRRGWVDIAGRRITAIGAHEGRARTPEIDLGNVALLPGLVNAHTHLELSWMRGRVAARDDFPDWIRDVVGLQRGGGPSAEAVSDAARRAINEARETGTVLFGDISNTLASVFPLLECGAAAVLFHELIGFQALRAPQILSDALGRLRALPVAADLRCTLAAHAPYSVSPALFRGIHQALGGASRCSVHLGESAAEIEFLRNGSGPWRSLLENLGAWDASWEVPLSDPVAYLDGLSFLDERLLAVHGVHLAPRDLDRLKRKRVTLVTCPRGNMLTGAGRPPISEFYRSGVAVAVGTDSLASVPDLNLFGEVAALRALAPELPARHILASATLNGARALGFDADFGSIEPGKRADLIAVAVPSDVSDVEEHLVSGITPEEVRPLGVLHPGDSR